MGTKKIIFFSFFCFFFISFHFAWFRTTEFPFCLECLFVYICWRACSPSTSTISCSLLACCFLKISHNDLVCAAKQKHHQKYIKSCVLPYFQENCHLCVNIWNSKVKTQCINQFCACSDQCVLSFFLAPFLSFHLYWNGTISFYKIVSAINEIIIHLHRIQTPLTIYSIVSFPCFFFCSSTVCSCSWHRVIAARIHAVRMKRKKNLNRKNERLNVMLLFWPPFSPKYISLVCARSMYFRLHIVYIQNEILLTG